MTNELRIETVVSRPFQENSYIAWPAGSQECLVVDPGFEPDRILSLLARQQLRVMAILNTHGHVDHIAGNAAIKDRFPRAPLIIGSGDACMLTDPFLNLSALGGVEVTSPPADQLVNEGEQLPLLGLNWDIRAIPGHSPGHVVFIWHGGNPTVVFGGDVLFAGGIGRFDFPGGDGELLIAGIREKLYTLPGDTIVYPGHGPTTSIAVEQATNPFTRPGARF